MPAPSSPPAETGGKLLSRGTRLVQNCWTVDSRDEAVEHWLSAGAGPFYTLERSFPDARYRGRIEPLSMKVALGQAGPIQIELIEQTSPGPSAYRDVAPAGGTAFHHMCKITEQFDEDLEGLIAAGIEVVTEIPGKNGKRTIYADTRAELGCMLELLPPTPELLAIYAIVADAAVDWDGSEPVRAMTPELMQSTIDSGRVAQ